jgi:hypothetical protein
MRHPRLHPLPSATGRGERWKTWTATISRGGDGTVTCASKACVMGVVCQLQRALWKPTGETLVV